MRLDELIDFNPRVSIKKGTETPFVPMDRVEPFTRTVTAGLTKPFTSGVKFLDGDTVMARITPSLENGKTSIYRAAEGEESVPAFGSTEFIVGRAKPGVSDPLFIYYLLTSETVRDVAIKSMTGSSGRQRVQLDLLKAFEIDVPDLALQREIGQFLGMLDDKIESNQQLCDTLEELAVSEFSYFVESGSGMKVERLGALNLTVTDYVANGSFATLKANVELLNDLSGFAVFVRNTDLKAGTFEKSVTESSYEFLRKTKLYGHEVVISNVGDVGSVHLVPDLRTPMTLGNNVIMLRSESDPRLNLYFYLYFKYGAGKGQIEGITGGSAQPKFNKTDFRSLPVSLPDTKNSDALLDTLQSPFELIECLKHQNRLLADLRAVILSQLLSGRLAPEDIPALINNAEVAHA